MNDYLTISYHQFFHSNGNFGVSVSPNPHNKDDEHPLISYERPGMVGILGHNRAGNMSPGTTWHVQLRSCFNRCNRTGPQLVWARVWDWQVGVRSSAGEGSIPAEPIFAGICRNVHFIYPPAATVAIENPRWKRIFPSKLPLIVQLLRLFAGGYRQFGVQGCGIRLKPLPQLPEAHPRNSSHPWGPIWNWTPT